MAAPSGSVHPGNSLIPPPPPINNTPKAPDIKLQVARNVKSVKNRGNIPLCSIDIARWLCASLRRQGDDQHTQQISCLHQIVEPVVQEGPKCGLVAVCMASQFLGNKSLSEDHVFCEAQRRGYTKQGEMFSASSVCSLAADLIPCEAKLVSGDHQTKKSAIIEALLTNQAVLVPYDRDCNNEPCMKNGCKAHWVLLAGFALCSSQPMEGEILQYCTADKEMKNLYHIKNHSQITMADGISHMLVHKLLQDSVPPSKVFVYAYQGKSIRTGLWDLDELLHSNSQLKSVDPKIMANCEEFIIPEDGIESTLCGRIVVMQK